MKTCPNTGILVRLSGINGPLVRLIAIPVSEQISNQRRAQLKKDSRNNPSKQHLALLSWTIFITNIESSDMDTKEILVLYSLRWRVEIMFKALKSYQNLDSIQHVSKLQLQFIIIGKMLLSVLICNVVYASLRHTMSKIYNKEISILKLTQYLSTNLHMLAEIISNLTKLPDKKSHLLDVLSNYACYDKRKIKRLN